MKTLYLYLLAVVVMSCQPSKPTQETPVQTQNYSTPVINTQAFDTLPALQSVIDKIYTDYAKKNHMPSIVYGVVANGKLILSGSAGFSNIEAKTNATTKSVYRIASMSKSFTAMAILKLRDEGKLSITNPVSQYIPEFKKAGALTSDAPAITVQNLMTMSAGFPEDNPWGDRQLDDTPEELLSLLKEGLSFSNVPGIAFEYSNLGYALLGQIISNVSGVPYQQYITENILKPLGMNNSYWEYDDIPNEQVALGYLWENEQWTPEPILHDGIYGAMGGMFCSLEDFAKYVALHLDAWPPRSDAEAGPVKRSSIREMHQPWRFNNIFANAKNRDGSSCPVAIGYGYGLGWRKDCSGKVRIAHSGGLPGYGSEWRFYPDLGIGVISFSNNRYGAPSGANAVALDTLVSIAKLSARTLPPSKILLERKEQLVKMFPGLEASPIFAENFFLDHSLENWQKDVAKIFTEAGTIKSVGDIKTFNQLRGEFVIECEKKKVNVFFTLTPEKNPLIQQLDVWME